MGEPQRESESKAVANFKSGTETAGAAEELQILVTINAPIGRVVKAEKIDKAGKHHELTQEEWANLIGVDETEDVDTALKEAFEAGVAVVLGEENEGDDGYDDKEEWALRQFLVGRLFRRSVRNQILHRLLAGRVLRSGSSEAGFSRKTKRTN